MFKRLITYRYDLLLNKSKQYSSNLNYKLGYIVSQGMQSSVNITSPYTEYELVSITIPKDGAYIICNHSFIENTISSVGYMFYLKQDNHLFARETTGQTLGWPNYTSISTIRGLKKGDIVTACVQVNYLNGQSSAGQAWCDLLMFMI